MSLLLTLHPVSWFLIIVAFGGGYLSGSVPYGLLLGRLAGLGDIREAGSGNIGATNVLRLGGKYLGVATLLLDALKGAIPVLIAKQVHMDYGVVAGLGAFIGHLYPVWLRFKGGKGVAVALGVTLALKWQVGLIVCLLWLATAMMSAYSSLAALTAFGLAPFIAAFLTADTQLIAFTLLLSVMIWVKHRANIKRLNSGTESKINLGAKDEKKA
jgi:glycerol-3-phosphate acyltransferase PlsY